MELALIELRDLLKAELLADANPVIRGFASLKEADAGDLSFFGNLRYLADLRATRASAVLVPRGFQEKLTNTAMLAVDNPSAAFAEVVKRFTPPPRPFVPGIHPSAFVDPSAILNREAVFIGPHAAVDAEAEIGDGTSIGAGCYIGHAAKLGRDCRLAPNVTVMNRCLLGDRVLLHSGVVLGADGFGYEFQGGRHVKIDQVGIVQIDNDVEIGANTTVDRARFGRTWIGEGTKIDNQVQIAHNCIIGRHCIIIAQVGIAGSTRIGDGVIIAAQSGVGGHLEIASGIVLSARSGVTKSLLKPGPYMGFPAIPAPEMRKMLISLRQLPEFMAGVKNERKVATNMEDPGSSD